MATTRRTPKEIEKDFVRIKDAAKKAISFQDIANTTGLTISQINTTLKKHPIIFKRIQQQLLDNGAILEQSEQIAETSTENQTENNIKNVVIDASISGYSDLKNYISSIINSNKKIILTSLTIRELEKLQHRNDITGEHTRYILREAAKHPELFENVLIEENLPVPDDRLIKFCADNKDNITLITADKTMVLKARMYKIEAEYLEITQHSNNFGNGKNMITPKNKDNAETKDSISNTQKPTSLKIFQIIDNIFSIPEFHTDKTSIRLIADGREYNEGPIEVHFGDTIYIARKNDNGTFTFWHYKLISLNFRNNCKLIFQKTMQNSEKLTNLPKNYQSFLKAFKYRHNI